MNIASSTHVTYASLVSGRVAPTTATQSSPASSLTATALPVTSAADRGERYEFTNMSVRERREVANKLFQSGQLTLDEAGVLGSMGPIARVDGQPLDDAALDSRLNAFDALNNAITFAKTHPTEKSGQAIYESLLNKLQFLQGGTSRIDTHA